MNANSVRALLNQPSVVFGCLGGWMLIYAAASQALPISTGPFPDVLTQPVAQQRKGPDGAQIKIVKQANTFNLSGAGVRIGQIEPGEPRTTHAAFSDGAGGSRVTPNGVPGTANNDHATGVADIMMGGTFTPPGGPAITGIASSARLFSTGYTDYQRPNSVTAFQNGVSFLTGNHVQVVNMSAGFYDAANPPNFLQNENGMGPEALIIDSTVRSQDVVWVKSAGNQGNTNTITVPGDAYNLITVGATGADAAGNASEDYTRVAGYSSRGPTADGRGKPDMVAPGSNILTASGTSDTATQSDSGASFAAPHVAGTAALLIERGVSTGLSHDHLAIKSVLMNGASKHVQAPDGAGGWQAWPNSAAGQSALNGASTTPLDDAMGIGQLNGLAAVRQYQPGFRSDVGLQGTSIDAGQAQSYDLFVGEQALKPGSLVTATLVWDRPVALTAGGDPTNAADYTGKALPDLDFKLLKRNEDGTSQVVASSTSTRDNVEHIYFNVRDEGHYQLQVNNVAATRVEDYAMAFTSGTSDGPAFSVDGGLFNPNRATPANPAEGRMAPFNGAPFPNDVNALGTAGPANFPTEGEIFTSSLNGTNMERLSGALGTISRVGPHNAPPAALAVLDTNEKGVMGLRPNDNVVGLSWGTDGTINPKTGRLEDSVLLFSVDPNASGVPGTDVHFQAVLSPGFIGPDPAPFPLNVPGGAPGNEAAGDIFKSQRFDWFGKYASEELAPAPPANNRLFVDEEKLGLQAPSNRGSLLGFQEDDLDALEMDSPLFVDPDGDGMHNKPIFFALDRWSVSLVGGKSADDIFISIPVDLGLDFDLMPDNPFWFDIFADGIIDINLRVGDAIDALVLSNIDSILGLDKRRDEALFSLDPFSTSIGFGANPADVYYTDFARPFNPLLDWKLGGSLFAPAALLGLLASDNLNALDIRRVPEPATVFLLLLGWMILEIQRRNHWTALRSARRQQ